MRKLDEAKNILNALQVPAKQQNGMCCCVLLAMANLSEDNAWGSAPQDIFGDKTKYKIVSEEKFQTDYHDYSWKITLIERIK